jgi:hypothetical protein
LGPVPVVEVVVEAVQARILARLEIGRETKHTHNDAVFSAKGSFFIFLRI